MSLPNLVEQIDKIIEDETISTKDGGTWWYLIRWKEKTSVDDTWADRGDL